MRRNVLAVTGIAAAILAVTVVVAADDDSGGGGGPIVDDRPDPVDQALGTVDWAARTADLDDPRWIVEFCEGEAPVLCLTDDHGSAGGVELTSWPVDTLDAVEEVLDAGGTDAEVLRAFEADFTDSFVEDRAQGCGPGHRVVPDEATPVTVAGRDGLRYGFRGVVDGRTVEHVVGHAVIVDDQLHLIAASGLAADGCLAPEGEFPIDAFDDATIDLLGRIAAASRLPTTAA